MLEETTNSTPPAPTSYRLRRLYHVAMITSTILITSLVLLTRLFRAIHPLESLLVWLAAEGGALTVIWFSFRRVSHLQSRYDEQAAQQAALIRLSEGFAATQDEAVICSELAQRLHAVQGYDYVAVYTLDAHNMRILRASLGAREEGDPVQLAPGQGLSERPLLDGRLHYSPDITREPHHVPGLLSGSEIDVPIRYQDNNLGVLIVESERINAFDEADFSLLTAAADQAAIALQYTQLLKSERERRRTAERLRSATAAITSALDVSAVLDQILIQLEQVVPYDSACVFLLRGNYIQAKAARGLPNPEEVLEQLLPADNKLFQAVVTNNHAVIIPDISKDERFLGWGGTASMKSWMGVPLRARGEIIGYLTLDSLELAAYQAEMSDLAQIFADQAAVALEHAQLYNRTRGAAERMLILHQISQEVISAGMDTEKIYQAVHQAAARLMPSEAFVISLLDENAGTIRAAYLFDRNGRSPEVIVPIDEGLSGHVIGTGQAVLEYDYLEGGALDDVGVVHFGSTDRIRAILAVPMRLGDKVFGMLSAQSYQPYDYTFEDQQLLEMLAAYTAIALDNAQLFEQVQHLAVTDSLTGVYNRRYFFDAARRELLRARRQEYPVSVIMLDLDRYKEINDTYGHSTGDQALLLIAEKIQQSIRESDLLARYGGDEFSILLPDTSLEQAVEIANRLRTIIVDSVFEVQEAQLHTSISLGVASTSPECADLKILMNNADAALYIAKHSGRNQVQSQA